MTFGNKLRQARKNKKYTQKELAKLIGAKHNSISNWENDQNKPDPDTIELICSVLDIKPNYLFNHDEDLYSKEEENLIEKYRYLDEHGREIVDRIIELEIKRMKNEELEDYQLKLIARNGKSKELIYSTKDIANQIEFLKNNFPNLLPHK